MSLSIEDLCFIRVLVGESVGKHETYDSQKSDMTEQEHAKFRKSLIMLEGSVNSEISIAEKLCIKEELQTILHFIKSSQNARFS